MNIYTKTGDRGTTSIIGGEIVSKSAIRVSAYGTIDELNSYVGLIISQLQHDIDLKHDLIEVQQVLFDCGTDMATPTSQKGYRTEQGVTPWLESKIDYYLRHPPKLTEFILPGGTVVASQLHIARTITRRAEREVVATSLTGEINPDVLKVLNRLSDYFYAAARLINYREGRKDINYRRNSQVFYN